MRALAVHATSVNCEVIKVIEVFKIQNLRFDEILVLYGWKRWRVVSIWRNMNNKG